MQRTQLPLNEIQVIDRQRTDLGDLEGLAASIRRYGLIQPLCVNQDKVLVAGGRRLAACRLLGLTHVDVVYRETLSQAELHELEIEENVRRKDMRWQEQCLAIAHVHKIRARDGALAGQPWTQSTTAELLGVSSGNVNYCLEVSRHLADPKSPMWACDSFREAWRLRLRMEEDAINAELRRRDQQVTATKEQIAQDTKVVEEAKRLETSEEVERRHAKERYLENPLNPVNDFDTYWEEHKTLVKKLASQAQATIYLSNSLLCMDSIIFMNDPVNEGKFDHIITDPPYAIDMDNIDQSNTHGGIADIDTVLAEHDEEENKDLLAQFFPAAFRCTKESAFVVTWADQMLWQYMYDLAVKAGFAVQRWPFTWVKSSACVNSNAQYNSTKTTEIAIVCRKSRATLAKPWPRSDYTASSTEVRKLLRHPFAKPFELWDQIIEHVTIQGQAVLEPFAGAGSGVIAMLRKGLVVTACEKNVAHFNNLVENIKREHYLKQNPNYVFK